MKKILAAAVLFAVVAIASAYLWHRFRLPARVHAGLPALPTDLARKPAELARRLAAAETLTRERAHAIEGASELGRLYHANGYLREAESCWRLLRAEQSKEARWSYYLADLRRTAGDGDAVASMLAETVRLAPNYAAAWLQLADFELKTGQTARAETHYRRRLELVPRDPYARLGLARAALQQDHRSDARQLIEQIVQDSPDFSTAHNLYAEMLAAEGRAEEAFRHRNLGREAGRFREAEDPWLDELQASCYDPKRLALLGTTAFQTRRGDRGVSYLRRAVELAPDDSAGYQSLGTLYLQLGEPAKAQPVFEQGLQLPVRGQDRVMLTVNLAESLRLQQRSADALGLIQKALLDAPKAYELHGELGAVLVDVGRIDESVKAYREAVALAPDDADLNFSLGSNLLVLGQREAAIFHLKRSLTLQPTYPKTLIVLGHLALEAGQLEEARRYWQPLYDSHPEQPTARHVLALYHLRAGEAAAAKKDAAAAEEHYRDGVRIDPDYAEIHANLGVLYLTQGRPTNALPAFEAYHRLRPKDAQSSLFLGQVYAQLGQFTDARKILAEGEQLAERAGNQVTAGYCREILGHLPPL
ncbi:MAG: tetratricopeptide repeat protein [Opitutus sp.]